MHISAKQQVPILKTVGGVFRTIRVPYMQYLAKDDSIQQLIFEKKHELTKIKILAI